MKNCPYCAEEIQDDAVKCKHCRELLGNQQGTGTPPRKGGAGCLLALVIGGIMAVILVVVLVFAMYFLNSAGPTEPPGRFEPTRTLDKKSTSESSPIVVDKPQTEEIEGIEEAPPKTGETTDKKGEEE